MPGTGEQSIEVYFDAVCAITVCMAITTVDLTLPGVNGASPRQPEKAHAPSSACCDLLFLCINLEQSRGVAIIS